MPPGHKTHPAQSGTYHNSAHVDHRTHHSSRLDVKKSRQSLGVKKVQKVVEPKPPYHVPKKKSYGKHLNLSSTQQYRHEPMEERHKHDRKAFALRAKLLENGYKSPMTLDDFNLDRTLGEGAFGRVVLASVKSGAKWDKKWDKKVAIKCLDKQQVLEESQVEHTTNEKNLLFCLESPMLATFYDFLVDKETIYFIMKLAPLEMFGMIHRAPYNGKLNVECTRFVAAQVVLALDYLNNLEVVYRDLKPENMVVDHRGNTKLIDLGFAKRLCSSTHRTYTLCGTPEYIAPEVLANKGYSFSVDWWGVGVLVYELRAGRSPFESFSELDLYRKIRACQYKFPSDFSIPEKLLIGGLLQIDPHKRLGVGAGGPDAVMKHPYFKGVDWAAMLALTVDSPIKVQLKSPDDVSNFEDDGDDDIRKPLKWKGKPVKNDYGGAFDHF